MIRKAHNAMTSSLQCTVGHFRPNVYLFDLVFAQTDNKIVAFGISNYYKSNNIVANGM